MTWLTVDQAAELLQLDHNTVRRWIYDGKITGYKLAGGRAIRIDADELDSFIRQGQIVPAAKAEVKPRVRIKHVTRVV